MTAFRDGFAERRCSLPSGHGSKTPRRPAQPGLLPRHVPRSRAASHLSRRRGSQLLGQAPHRRRAALRMGDPRLGDPRQSRPPSRRDHSARAVVRNAPAQRTPCDGIQQAIPTGRPPLSEPLRVARRRRRPLPRSRDELRLRELVTSGPRRLAVARPRLAGGGCCARARSDYAPSRGA